MSKKKKKWVAPEIKNIEIKNQEWKAATGCPDQVYALGGSLCCQ